MGTKRRKYLMFRGEEWEKNLDFDMGLRTRSWNEMPKIPRRMADVEICEV